MIARVSTVAFQASRRLPVDVQAQFVSGQVNFLVVGFARQGGGRKPRAGAFGAACHRPGADGQAAGGQSLACRPAEGRQPLRPADCAGPALGAGRHPSRIFSVAMS